MERTTSHNDNFKREKTFLFESKKLELISRCARQMYYKMYYKIYFIYFRQFYKRRNFFADIDQISKPWKETTSQTYKPQEGKNFCLIEKSESYFKMKCIFASFYEQFHNAKNSTKKTRSIILALKVISHLQPLNTHISIHYCTFSIFNQIQTIKKRRILLLTCVGNKLSKNQMVLQYSLHRYSQ